ncbi:flagellar hook-basal body complex protein FliE [Legionella nagasakiensis]|uniref:flagellar hook-basal body complex protein FliE n=1 Tax=Legionella nagasakiensis TaxID=535290 RepID=UPI001056060C|nr:flagellar hook-basal body complex protein FliE [Legionella nagasakiensis]
MSMTSSPISRAEISETLEKIRALSSQNKALNAKSVAEATAGTEEAQFNQVLSVAKNSLSDINNLQHQTELLKTAYISGDANVSVSEVMAAKMKSSIAFEGLLVVRNKLLDAYKEIMNMPI